MRPSITTKLLFLILLSSVVAAAQSPMQAPARSAPKAAQAPISDFGPNAPYKTAPPPRMDIPAIAKAAKGTIVTIVMADNDKPIAQGTGFLVSADGVVVTNYHVIETGNFAVVKFPDGTVLPVEGILAADKVRDLAIVKIHGKTFSTVRLGDSNQVQVGEEVVAIGNPLGLELTVSNGIVSGLRSTKEGRFLQTTAPISPGSSGGPLFNMYGQVIGINTMYLEGGENLNFAIPINDAQSLLQERFETPHALPNEAEKATRVDAQSSVKYHIAAYDPSTGVVTIRHGNQLLTAVVYLASVCKVKVVESPNDCEDVLSAAPRMVGQDATSRDEGDPDTFREKSVYSIEQMPDVLMVTEGHDDWTYPPGGPYKSYFRIEWWRIKKVEAMQP